MRFFLINVRFVVFAPQIIIGLSRLGGIHIVIACGNSPNYTVTSKVVRNNINGITVIRVVVIQRNLSTQTKCQWPIDRTYPTVRFGVTIITSGGMLIVGAYLIGSPGS